MSVQVQFSPTLSEDNIRDEAVRLAVNRAMEEERLGRVDAGETTVQSPDSKRKVGPGGGKHRRSVAQQPTASPLVSSITSLAAASSSLSTPPCAIDSKDHLFDRKGSLPVPELG